MRLSPTSLLLPSAPEAATEEVASFYAAATRAIRHTYEDDVDDASMLAALEARLSADAALVPARAVWLPALRTAQRRAATLRSLGPTLRALRQALANAWRDELRHTYRDIDASACRLAAQQMPVDTPDRDTPLQDTVVTIEPFGAYPLSTFQRFCEDSRGVFAQDPLR